MFISPVQGAFASTNPSATLPSGEPETVRHMLIGTPQAVQATIQLLHKLNYAEPNDWSQPIPMSKPNEVMAILTKRVRTV